jgi:hypothetical protein
MTKYQYYVHVISESETSVQLQEILNQLGEKGWDMVNLYRSTESHAGKDPFFPDQVPVSKIIFKRPYNDR